MIREVKFESQDRRIKGIIEALNANGIKDIEEANAICEAAGLDPYKTCEETQPICFENAKWAYVVGCAIAIKKGCKNAADAAEAIGIGLQAFCIPGSVADDRKVGIGHGNLAAQTLAEVFQRSANSQTAFRESRLSAAVNDLQEQFAHSSVDSVANEVGVERLEKSLAREDLRSHSGRVGHT